MTEIFCLVNDRALKSSDFRSEHGLSFWIGTEDGDVIFDTGQTPQVLSHNLKLSGFDPDETRAVVISHSHYDHTGGLPAIVPGPQDRRLIAHPDLLLSRYSRREGKYKSIGCPFSEAYLEEHFDLVLSRDPVEVLPNLLTTGEISNRPEPEGRSSGHFIKTESGWKPDPYRDDLSLVLKTSGSLALICGCCHAGLLNTLNQVSSMFSAPIKTIIGGTHLIATDGRELAHVMEELEKNFPQAIYYLNHCTGVDAIRKLADAFPGRVNEFLCGESIEL